MSQSTSTTLNESQPVPKVTNLGGGVYWCNDCGSCPGNVHYFSCGAAEPGNEGDVDDDAAIVTANGVRVTVDARVFTNDCKWGVIEAIDTLYNRGWASVRYPDGTTGLYNGTRLSTVNNVDPQKPVI